MPPINLLIKPASGHCNLNCRYCFYHAIMESRDTKSYGMMTQETLEELVKKALEYAEHVCTFAFQGGEPTLVGLDFYKNLMEYQQKYNTKKIKIHNAIQTNGMLIDDEWASFLAKHHFLVGISLDGPKDIHDMQRIDRKENGSFVKVMSAIKLLEKHQVEFNILTVVHASVARHIQKIYAFFRKNHFDYLQFIPCLDALNEDKGQQVHSLTPERYEEFLKKLFDLWYADIAAGQKVSIRFFDNLVGMYMGYRPEACDMNGICSCQFVVEADGSTYPCDFYVMDEYRMGNILIDPLEDMKNRAVVHQFIEASTGKADACKNCQWVNLCRGGCRRLREPASNEAPVLNYYCSAYKAFFEYADERLQRLAVYFKNRV